MNEQGVLQREGSTLPPVGLFIDSHETSSRTAISPATKLGLQYTADWQYRETGPGTAGSPVR